MECHCGGGIEVTHKIGEPDCLREEVEKENNPILIDPVKDMWKVEGDIITGHTLRQQRMYAHHGNNDWSRPKDHESVNSLPDET